MPDMVRVRRALISVSDKTGVVAFARDLASQGVEIVSTGGTARALVDAGVKVRPIDDLTGFPEMMDGRIKTLHPKVHGGILALRDNPDHVRAMSEHAIEAIDLVCVNLYPFRRAVSEPGCTREHAIENIDIGGPSMVRSAAKNHEHVAVLTDPHQYGAVLAEMNVTDGCTSRGLRRQLAHAAFAHTADYDAAIAAYLSREEAATPSGTGGERESGADEADAMSRFPSRLTLHFDRLHTLRYGENPHQAAAVYADPRWRGPSVVNAAQLHGKELSYNNLFDAAATLDIVIALARLPSAHAAGTTAGGVREGTNEHAGHVAAACIKHANPCGCAVAGSPLDAVRNALAGDPIAAFGGIIAVSGRVDAAAAARLCEKDVFLEVLVAEEYEPAALEALRSRWQNLRILATGPLAGQAGDGTTSRVPMTVRAVRGGLLVQEADTLAPDPGAWQCRAGPTPSPEQLEAAAAIEVMVRAMNSNAVALGAPVGKDQGGGVMLVGSGLGQVDRVSACRLAVEKAGARARGAIAVSDAFFPFADGPTALIDAGVAMIVHPGGSKRDEETFALCAKRGVTCMTTGVRRFRH